MGRWCQERNLITEDFTKGIKLLKAVERPRTWLSKSQRDKLLEMAKESPYYPMLTTALYAGLRWRELVTLEWQDLDFKRRVITVKPKDDWTPKSKRPRIIPMHPKLRTILAPLQQKEGPCFPSEESYKYHARVIKQWLKEIGIRGNRVGWHTFRHSFAAQAVQSGVPIWTLSQWLGHREVTTTQLYAHLVQGYSQDIAKI